MLYGNWILDRVFHERRSLWSSLEFFISHCVLVNFVTFSLLLGHPYFVEIPSSHYLIIFPFFSPCTFIFIFDSRVAILEIPFVEYATAKIFFLLALQRAPFSIVDP